MKTLVASPAPRKILSSFLPGVCTPPKELRSALGLFGFSGRETVPFSLTRYMPTLSGAFPQ